MVHIGFQSKGLTRMQRAKKENSFAHIIGENYIWWFVQMAGLSCLPDSSVG